MISALQEVEDILSESLPCVMERERSALGRLLDSAKNKVVLFGAGNLGRRSLACLRSIGVEPLAMTDRNPRLWGSEIEGCPVLSPKDAAELYGSPALFIVTIWNANHWYGVTQQELWNSGCPRVAPVSAVYWRFADDFLPFFCQDLPHKLFQERDGVLRAATVWSDEQSRGEYASQIRWRAQGDWSWLKGPDPEESYFPESIFQLSKEEAFVDCGAFDGDTIQAFLTRNDGDFQSILAIEADALTYPKLTSYISGLEPNIRERINALHCAVGAQREMISFSDTGGVDSHVGKGGTSTVECFPLDDLLENRPASYIKMDIEGAEYDVLVGGRQTIARDRPIIAFCVYHTQNDIWRLPLLIREIVPDYRFYLRLHEGDGWQTVAYAVPPERA